MHIWVDGQCFQTASRERGIGRYVWELLRAMRDGPNPPRISLSLNATISDNAIVARETLGAILDPRDIHVWEGPARQGEISEGYTVGRRLGEAALAHHVNCIAPDIALGAAPFEDDRAIPFVSSPLVNAPQACIFYDAIPYRFPDRYLFHPGTKKAFLRKLDALAGFDLALCISDFARRELNDIHPDLHAVNISAGISGSLRELVARPSKHRIRKKARLADGYVLYVGANDWRKNIRAIIDAYAKLPRAFVRKHPLVLAGASDDVSHERDRRMWSIAGLPRECLVNLGRVSDEELVELYRGASVLIQPSLMEGFGLPSLEALAVGTPVLAADAGAVPEVVGAPEFLFDPHEPEELARKLRHMVERPETLEKPMEAARQRAAGFTWENTSATALKALGELAKGADVSTGGGLEAMSASRISVCGRLDDAVRLNPRTPRVMALAEPVPPSQGRVLLDATYIANMDHRTGIQRVVRQTIEHMAKAHPRDVTSFYISPEEKMLDTGGVLALPADEETNVIRPRREDTLVMIDSAWNEIVRQLPRLEEHRLRGGRIVFVVYDLVVLRAYGFSPDFMPPIVRRWFSYMLRYATGIVCISKAVADEVLELLAAIDCPRRIDVGYWQLGADLPRIEAAADAANGRKTPRGAKRARSRFIMVGTMEPRKGYNVALDAFDLLWEADENVELAIIGRMGWASEHTVARINAHPELGRRLTWHSNIEDDELARFYGEADALVTASYVEGFGLPVVEAGHYGKPVIASDLPVFREVAKGARGASFFETGSAEALARTVRAFMRAGPQEPAASRAASWPDWAESAEQLYRLVTQESWYGTHHPEDAKAFREMSDIGKVRMEEPIPPGERAIEFDVLEGPIRRPENDGVDYVVKVHNPTERIWSSDAVAGGGPVYFAWQWIDPESFSTLHEGGRVTIPFVLYPRDTHYVRFHVTDRPRPGALLRFDAVQEGVDWFTL